MEKDIQYYLDHPDELERFVEGVEDNDLTAGRIRTICAQVKHGTKRAYEIAHYYDLPVDTVRDIASGKIFGEITKDIREGDV